MWPPLALSRTSAAHLTRVSTASCMPFSRYASRWIASRRGKDRGGKMPAMGFSRPRTRNPCYWLHVNHTASPFLEAVVRSRVDGTPQVAHQISAPLPKGNGWRPVIQLLVSRWYRYTLFRVIRECDHSRAYENDARARRNRPFPNLRLDPNLGTVSEKHRMDPRGWPQMTRRINRWSQGLNLSGHATQCFATVSTRVGEEERCLHGEVTATELSRPKPGEASTTVVNRKGLDSRVGVSKWNTGSRKQSDGYGDGQSKR